MDARIMIGCPVRNRAWILPRYLEHLKRLDYPAHLLEYCFIINNCTDHTEALLTKYALQSAVPTRLIKADSGSPEPVITFQTGAGARKEYGGHQRGRYSLTRLAVLRNMLLEAFLDSPCHYLFSLDSDILAPPHTLSNLLANDLPVVSALVCNGHQVGDEGIYNVLRREANHYEFIRDFPRDRCFEVDCTGAAYLIRRDIIEDYGVTYSAEKGGEDIGFCEMAAAQGIKLYCDGRIECMHVMEEGTN